MRTLVLEGGGMRGAFNFGVLAAFNRHGIKSGFFDNYVGTSAGAYNMAYFITDQVPVGFKVWEELLVDNFVKYQKGRPRFNIEYLRKMLTEDAPLDFNKIRKAKQKAFLPLSNPETCDAEYFCLNTYPDILDLMLINAEPPFLTKPNTIDGKHYYDGGITALIPLEKAKQLGSDEIWVVCNTPAGYRRKRWKYWLSASLTFRKPGLRKLLLSRPKRENALRREIEESKKFIVIRPEKPLPVTWISRNKGKVTKALELGIEAAEKVLREKGLLKENLK